ncbi:Aste57867_18903 [Aphanomyces stellatus]|uniref:Aste57867_18903 protein n=1 Tax=Aphanomyces stellatus TaxID=120398 RepID=A0A485LBL4_9STRA|nr:hypothetical protein As57867_018839 [Aphanomyces stellatus]VFT95635.1 Aste57867_18903 [Aphanomyces stellatus]
MGRTALQGEARIERKRKVLREKMQRYRKRVDLKNALMKQSAEDMEVEIARLLAERATRGEAVVAPTIRSSARLLSWEDVALALREGVTSSEEANAHLRRKIDEQKHLIQLMRAWVNRSFVLPDSTWRHVTLLADPHARKLGFDWITQHMFHNTSWVFERYEFPLPSPVRMTDEFVDASRPDCLQYVWRDQQAIDASFDDVCEIVNLDFFLDMMVHGAVSKAPLPMDMEMLAALGGGTCGYTSSIGTNEALNQVYRMFHSDRRRVFVAMNVHRDECIHWPARWTRNRMSWLAVDKVSPTHTVLRTIYLQSQGFTGDYKYNTLAEEAAGFNIQLDFTGHDESSLLPRYIHDATQIMQYSGAKYGSLLERTGASLQKK